MLYLIILLVAGKHIKKAGGISTGCLKKILNRFFQFVLLIHIIAAPTNVLPAQTVIRNYKVVQNSHTIGWLKLKKTDSANSSVITLSSQIRKRLIFLFNIKEEQEVYFEDGIMVHSSVRREINDDTKINKTTVLSGNSYTIKNGGTLSAFHHGNIGYNQLSLYFREPVNMTQVYSDTYEHFLELRKLREAYVLELPGGNKNYYYYTNGICSKVKVVQTLFTVEFILCR